MRNFVANPAVVDPWTELLRQARTSLSALRGEELEELAGRAECMLEATIGDGAVRQRMPGPQRELMTGMAREHGLLRSLLLETDQNLRVLRGLRQDGPRSVRSGEVDSRWVR